MKGSWATGSGLVRISVTMGVFTVLKDRDPCHPRRYMAWKERGLRSVFGVLATERLKMHQIEIVPRRVALHSPDTTPFFVGCASVALMATRIVATAILCILNAAGRLGGKPSP